ncbi:MAG: LPS export ABC transporter periplasmic protein LptC, partial [Saprospiraceae bacterium]|nr:LPS export ABC transporter periplasmic protein LptC [Saprospiraceae bacterium]
MSLRATLLLLFSFLTVVGFSQQQLQIKNGDLELTNPDQSDQYLWLFQNEKGQVKLIQETTTLESDSTQYYQSRNYAKALGNVFINQNDSIEIYSNSAEYFGNESKTTLRGEVALIQDVYTLQTDLLNYDLKREIATYTAGGQLSDTTSTLTSKRGKYYATTKLAEFRDSVVLVTPERRIETDTMDYNMETKRAAFKGPTTIIEDGQIMKTTSGWYNTDTGEAFFDGKPEIDNEETYFKADLFEYGKEGDGKASGNVLYIDKTQELELKADNAQLENEKDIFAKGNVFLEDKKNGITLTAEEADIFDSKKEFYARNNALVKYPKENFELLSDSLSYFDEAGLIYSRGRPIASTLFEGDSLYMVAKEMTAIREVVNGDSIYNFVADKAVKIFKSDLQAVADSAYYNATDSTLTFFKDPVIWTDSTQMSADTITLFIKNQEIDKIHLRKNGFIVNLVEKGLYNQIKGREIDAFFVDGNIDNMLVSGNAETIYYVQEDDGAFIGIDKMRCGQIRVLFEEQDISEIFWLNQPQGSTTPFKNANLSSFRLANFRWREAEKPTSKNYLLRAIGRLEGGIPKLTAPVD